MVIRNKNYLVAGLTRIADFPINPVMALNFSHYLDYLVLGFDTTGGYSKYVENQFITAKAWYELFKTINPFDKNVKVDLFESKTYAGSRNLGDHFLEEMLRRLDDVKPDIVLECEADASFDYEHGFLEDLEEFACGEYDVMLMQARTMAVDGRFVAEFPLCEHCRAYKWFEGVTYCGGNGFCQPCYTGREMRIYRAKTKLLHFPVYTREMEEYRWVYYGEEKVREIHQRDEQVRIKDESCIIK